jgi:hypothetical protein
MFAEDNAEFVEIESAVFTKLKLEPNPYARFALVFPFAVVAPTGKLYGLVLLIENGSPPTELFKPLAVLG